MSETEHIEASAVIDAPADKLFEKIADYRSAERLIDGLESMVPRGTVTSGEGARFDAVMRVGPRTFNTTIGITHYAPPSAITWSSGGSQAQVLTFRFEPQDDGGRVDDVSGGTKVTLAVSYDRPGGFTGLLVAPVVEQTVRAKVNSTLERLRADVA